MLYFKHIEAAQFLEKKLIAQFSNYNNAHTKKKGATILLHGADALSSQTILVNEFNLQ